MFITKKLESFWASYFIYYAPKNMRVLSQSYFVCKMVLLWNFWLFMIDLLILGNSVLELELLLREEEMERELQSGPKFNVKCMHNHLNHKGLPIKTKYVMIWWMSSSGVRAVRLSLLSIAYKVLVSNPCPSVPYTWCN